MPAKFNCFISLISRYAITFVVGFCILSQPAQAACNECGTVTDVKTIKIEGHASGVGIVAGGILGGVLGHQVGGGRGNDLATIGGAAGGAYAGNEVEKKSKTKTKYQVIVEMADGSTKTFTYSSHTSYQIGDLVKVKEGKLIRQ